MLLDNKTELDIRQAETCQTPEQPKDTLFQEKDYYAGFLRNLGVTERYDGALYRLVPQEGKHWTPRLDDVAAAVRQLAVQENVPFEEALSVLSLVADKLDGNRPVPQPVRSYMCKEALKRAVMQRFKEATGEAYANLTELAHKISDNLDEANETFNTIRICDPSMGSGFFLATMLNELIALKSRLGILADKQGNPLFQYKVTVDGDDLSVFDKKRFSVHSFSDTDAESLRIREALLHEKRILIEQCLFGAGINPTSVSIGRVRLWLEFLKHFRWDVKQAVLPLVASNLRRIEWRYEMPELLHENGDFAGFDVVIGNPPGDFYELGYRLLKQEYFLSCISSNSWMRSASADNLIAEINPLLLIEFADSDKPENTLAGQEIILLQKTHNQRRMMNCRINAGFDIQEDDIEAYVAQNETLSLMEKEEVTPAGPIVFSILSDTEKHLIHKIEKAGMSLGAWDIRMYPGIKTGYDEAFVIDGKAKDEFIRADYKNVDILKPLLMGGNIRRYVPGKSDHWLISIPWHFPLLYDKTITTASERAELRFQQQYPVVYEYLTKYKKALSLRDAEGVGVAFEWYALLDFGTSHKWDDFTQPKIVWKQEAETSNFCLDYSGCALLDTTCFAAGQHLRYLLGVLNSKLGRYMLRDAPRLSNGYRQISILTLEALKVPVPNIKIESEVTTLVSKRTSDSHSIDNEEIDKKIDRLVYDIYQLNDEEREFVEINISYF
ncbi:MAG: hypothetical protein LBN71_11470 [Tannerella sp.]|jgi:hypothetical protein|nr:hypothetical protein [Tannerella sp.]